MNYQKVKGDSTPVKISDLVTGDLLLGEGDAQYTYLLALATKMFDENNNDIKVTMPGKKEFGLSKAI